MRVIDRSTVYVGAIPLDTDWLFPQRATMVGLAGLSEAVLGTTPVIDGLHVQPTTPISRAVVVTAGQIYARASLDPVVYGSMPADTAHQIVKQGIQLDPTTIPITPPGTTGFSQRFLIQVAYQDQDGGSVVLPYYNSANPSQPWAGPGNSGQQQYTQRIGAAVLQVKAGPPESGGAQNFPQPDPGWVGLAWVTVSAGQAVILPQDITAYTPSSRLSVKLPALAMAAATKVVLVRGARTLRADEVGLTVIDVGAFEGAVDVRLPPANSVQGVSLRHKAVGRYITARSRRGLGYARFLPAGTDTLDTSFAYCGPNDALEFVSDGASRWYWTGGRAAASFMSRAASAQSIPSGVTTAIVLTGNDPVYLPEYWNAAAPTRLYIPAHSRVRFTGNIAFAPNGTGNRQASVTLNGSLTGGSLGWVSTPAVAGIATGLALSGGPRGAYDGDYAELFAYQSSGAPLDIVPDQTWLALEVVAS